MRAQLQAWQDETVDYGMLEDSPEIKKAFVEYGIQSSSKYAEKAEKLRNAIEKDLISE